MSNSPKARSNSRARSMARKLAMQALYQWQLNAQPWEELHSQALASDEASRADAAYLQELIERVCDAREALDSELAPFVDRPLPGLDPIEHAILLIGAYELKMRADIPYRVVINEGVELARRFGATDGHKFVNAVLDRAAASLRASERDTHAG
jgi:N utilization substance protein B